MTAQSEEDAMSMTRDEIMEKLSSDGTTLDLGWTQVTDAGLAHLAGLANRRPARERAHRVAILVIVFLAGLGIGLRHLADRTIARNEARVRVQCDPRVIRSEGAEPTVIYSDRWQQTRDAAAAEPSRDDTERERLEARLAQGERFDERVRLSGLDAMHAGELIAGGGSANEGER